VKRLRISSALVVAIIALVATEAVAKEADAAEAVRIAHLLSAISSSVIAIIDFRPTIWLWPWKPSGVPQNRGGHGIPPSVVEAEFIEAGFVLVYTIEKWSDDWPHTCQFVSDALMGLQETEVRRRVGESALECYGFDRSVLEPIAERGGPDVTRFATHR
jgi:hypothetical protein